MTNPDEPAHGVEYPALENAHGPIDPYAPVDYPSDYPPPPGLAPPIYPQPGGYGGYPAGYPVGYPSPYSGYTAGPYDPYGPPRPAGINGKAVGALVTSLVGLPLCFCFVPSLVAIVLGVVAMRETRRTNQDGHGIALAGVIIAGLSIVLTLAMIVISTLTGSTVPSS
jgi:hypothetical protein